MKVFREFQMSEAARKSVLRSQTSCVLCLEVEKDREIRPCLQRARMWFLQKDFCVVCLEVVKD